MRPLRAVQQLQHPAPMRPRWSGPRHLHGDLCRQGTVPVVIGAARVCVSCIRQERAGAPQAEPRARLGADCGSTRARKFRQAIGGRYPRSADDTISWSACGAPVAQPRCGSSAFRAARIRCARRPLLHPQRAVPIQCSVCVPRSADRVARPEVSPLPYGW